MAKKENRKCITNSFQIVNNFVKIIAKTLLFVDYNGYI
jgi:hypothetical protein